MFCKIIGMKSKNIIEALATEVVAPQDQLIFLWLIGSIKENNDYTLDINKMSLRLNLPEHKVRNSLCNLFSQNLICGEEKEDCLRIIINEQKDWKPLNIYYNINSLSQKDKLNIISSNNKLKNTNNNLNIKIKEEEFFLIAETLAQLGAIHQDTTLLIDHLKKCLSKYKRINTISTSEQLTNILKAYVKQYLEIYSKELQMLDLQYDDAIYDIENFIRELLGVEPLTWKEDEEKAYKQKVIQDEKKAEQAKIKSLSKQVIDFTDKTEVFLTKVSTHKLGKVEGDYVFSYFNTDETIFNLELNVNGQSVFLRVYTKNYPDSHNWTSEYLRGSKLVIQGKLKYSPYHDKQSKGAVNILEHHPPLTPLKTLPRDLSKVEILDFEDED